MIASLGNVDYVALLCRDQRQALDQVIDLAFHDVPELGVVEMEVPLVGFRRRRSTTSADKVGEAAVIRDERSSALSAFDDLGFKIEIRTVLIGVCAAASET